MLTLSAAWAALIFCAGLSVLTLVCVGTLLFVRARPVSSYEARIEATELKLEALNAQFKRLLNSRAGRASAKAAAEAEDPQPARELTVEEELAQISAQFGGNGARR